MLRQLPTLLLALSALTFGAGLTAIVTEPSPTPIKLLALFAGVLLFVAGWVANMPAVRRQIPLLRTPTMKLIPLYQEGERFDNELGAIPRDQLDAPDLWARLQRWDARVSRLMASELGESWSIYKRSIGDLTPPGSNGWAEVNRQNVSNRLSRIAQLIHEKRI